MHIHCALMQFVSFKTVWHIWHFCKLTPFMTHAHTLCFDVICFFQDCLAHLEFDSFQDHTFSLYSCHWALSIPFPISVLSRPWFEVIWEFFICRISKCTGMYRWMSDQHQETEWECKWVYMQISNTCYQLHGTCIVSSEIIICNFNNNCTWTSWISLKKCCFWLQIACGPDHYIYYVSVRWPGLTHDSRVFRESSLHIMIKSGEF